jgi:sensor histidine kinase YesM
MVNLGSWTYGTLSKLGKYKIHHVMFWMLYYAFWVFTYKSVYKDFSLLLKITAVYMASHATAYYTSQYFLSPKLLQKNKPVVFLISFLCLCISMSFVMYFSISSIMGASPNELFSASFFQILSVFFFSNFFAVGIMLAIKGFFDTRKMHRKNEILEKERLESELQFLKSQVNPHFLFNAINSVYVLIRINPELASETLIKLSNLLRSQLYDFSAEKIEIQQELEYLKNYIELEKIRKGERLELTFEEGEGLEDFSIAPLVLIPFLENCFKHLSTHTDRPNVVKVKIGLAGNFLLAYFYNTTEPKGKNQERNTGGIGLVNIKRRLELLYPKSHWLETKESEDSYEVNLKIRIR